MTVSVDFNVCSVNLYQATRCHVSVCDIFQVHGRGKIKSVKIAN